MALKRIWSEVGIDGDPGNYRVLLDGRPVMTPARRPLAVPLRRIAERVAEEWDAQVEEVDPRTMPFMRSTATCIDRVAPERDAVAAILAEYGGTDLICYRAERPAALVARQVAAWDPVLAWLHEAHGARLVASQGVMPVDQSAEALDRLHRRVSAAGPWELTALADLVTISGSLAIGLAVLDQAIEAAEGWRAARVDEQWNADEWGEDEDARATAKLREEDFLHAARLLDILRAGDPA